MTRQNFFRLEKTKVILGSPEDENDEPWRFAVFSHILAQNRTPDIGRPISNFLEKLSPYRFSRL